jgi:enterobactin C-glucosyltransferase
MRVLFTVNPGTTTFTCVVSLAWALRGAGHDVRIASQPLFADDITQAGLTAVGVGRDLGVDRLLTASGAGAEELEALRPGLPWPYRVVEEPDGLGWEDLVACWHGLVEHNKFEAFALTGGAVEFARAWEPDLVVWEPFTPAGAIVAKACGAASARLLYGVDVFASARKHFLATQAAQPEAERGDPVADWLGGYARKYGTEFSEDMVTGHFTIDQLPASLQVEADDVHYLRTQHIPYCGAAVLPKWLQAKPAKPRVALTLGTTATGHFAGYTIDVQDVLDSLSDVDVEVVATIPQSQQPRRVPDNVRMVSWVPMHELAPTCTAAITHAGFGTLSVFARYGVPQLTLPYHFDEPMLGTRLAELGAGLTAASDATGQTVRDGVLRLLADADLRDGATRLRDEIRALPTPGRLVGQLEQCTTKYRTQ